MQLGKTHKTQYLQVLEQCNVWYSEQSALLIALPGFAHSCLQDCTGFIFDMYASACFVTVYQDIGQNIQQLRAGKPFSEGLYGPLSVHEDDRISCLHKLADSTDERRDNGKAATQSYTCRNCSTDKAPLVPPLKLSMNLIHLLSSGTVVPPEVTQTIGRPGSPSTGACLQMNACTEESTDVAGAGASSKNWSTVNLSSLDMGEGYIAAQKAFQRLI